MSFNINWDFSLSVGVPRLDMQHQKMFCLVNELSASLKDGDSKAQRMFNGFIEFCRVHFAAEELLFAEFKYIYAIEHKLEHDQFIEKASELKFAFPSVSWELTDRFLKTWLKTHVENSDKLYRICFESHLQNNECRKPGLIKI